MILIKVGLFGLMIAQFGCRRHCGELLFFFFWRLNLPLFRPFEHGNFPRTDSQCSINENEGVISIFVDGKPVTPKFNRC